MVFACHAGNNRCRLASNVCSLKNFRKKELSITAKGI
jgi:hypothetical protein